MAALHLKNTNTQKRLCTINCPKRKPVENLPVCVHVPSWEGLGQFSLPHSDQSFGPKLSLITQTRFGPKRSPLVCKKDFGPKQSLMRALNDLSLRCEIRSGRVEICSNVSPCAKCDGSSNVTLFLL